MTLKEEDHHEEEVPPPSAEECARVWQLEYETQTRKSVDAPASRSGRERRRRAGCQSRAAARRGRTAACCYGIGPLTVSRTQWAWGNGVERGVASIPVCSRGGLDESVIEAVRREQAGDKRRDDGG